MNPENKNEEQPEENELSKWYKETAQFFLDLNNSNPDPKEVYPRNRYSGD